MSEKKAIWNGYQILVKPEGVTHDHYVVDFYTSVFQDEREHGEQASRIPDYPNALVCANKGVLDITWINRPLEKVQECESKVRELVEECIALAQNGSNEASQ